jgi:hypothetical protein
VTAIHEEIRNRFQSNLARVRNILAVYLSGPGKGRGRRGVQETDLLRAAVVLLHATLEDLLRSLAEWKLPMASPESLAEIPLAGTKRGTRVGLQELAGFRGRTVDEVIADSVKEHLEKSNDNHPGDVKSTLEQIGLDPRIVDGYSAELAAMMTRRHWIAHRADRNTRRGAGHHPTKSLPSLAVSRWIDAVEQFGQDILSRF